MTYHNTVPFFVSMLSTIAFIGVFSRVFSRVLPKIIDYYKFVVVLMSYPEKLLGRRSNPKGEDFHERTLITETLENSSKNWCVTSTLVVGYLGITSLIEYGLSDMNIKSCTQIENYDLTHSMYPLGILTGYFVYDIIFNSPSPQFLFHHILGIGSSIIIIFTGYSIGAYYYELLLITEISTVFLNMYHLCVNTKKRKLACMTLFTLSFTIVRPLYMFRVLIKIFECFRYEKLYCALCVSVLSLYALNMYWYVAIIKKIYNLIKKSE